MEGECCFIFILYLVIVFFFFQAEDGIRDLTVTGVQTCALPISLALVRKDLHDFFGSKYANSDLTLLYIFLGPFLPMSRLFDRQIVLITNANEIGRASCRERV